MKLASRFFASVTTFALSLATVGFVFAAVPAPLTINEARVCVTGADQNRPAPFPGLGDFIGWPGGIDRMPNGDLLLGHSAGYWHSSFADPRQIEPQRTGSIRSVSE